MDAEFGKHVPMRHAAQRRLTGALLSVLSLAFSGCRWTPPDPVVQRALVCDECTSGQIEAVVTRGDSVVPMLLSALTLPPPQLLADVRGTLIREWQRANRALPANATADSAKTVNAGIERFITAYQSRAAYLLKRIGTPAARRALKIGVVTLAPEKPGLTRPEARRLADSLRRAP